MQTPSRQSSRTRKKTALYAPSEVIRDRSEGRADKKRRRRRRCISRKRKQKLFNLPDLVDADSSDDSGVDEVVASKCRKPVTNVCVELDELMAKAAQVQKDFPNDVKINMPSFRCLQCRKCFPLAGYRKVCIYAVTIIMNLCKKKPSRLSKQNKKNSLVPTLNACSAISKRIWKRIAGSKRVR